MLELVMIWDAKGEPFEIRRPLAEKLTASGEWSRTPPQALPHAEPDEAEALAEHRD